MADRSNPMRRHGTHPDALIETCTAGRKRSVYWRADAALRWPFVAFTSQAASSALPRSITYFAQVSAGRHTCLLSACRYLGMLHPGRAENPARNRKSSSANKGETTPINRNTLLVAGRCLGNLWVAGAGVVFRWRNRAEISPEDVVSKRLKEWTPYEPG